MVKKHNSLDIEGKYERLREREGERKKREREREREYSFPGVFSGNFTSPAENFLSMGRA